VSEDCLFCKIVNKEIDANLVHEGENVVAFRDINPQASTHVLVIPKRHIASAHELYDGDGALLAELFNTISALAEGEGLDSGYRVVTNVGPDAGQTVHHLHLHLLGGRPMSWPPG
jgi:histidine triad (HIT) family protein